MSYARHRPGSFTFVDGLILVAIMAIGTAVTIPLLDAVREPAKASALQQNLQALRSRIAQYKLEHGDDAPLLYKGTFPQLTEATNAEGVPGPPGKKYPHGPYFPAGIPVNPYTGISAVTATEDFPPTAASGIGGWLYHQPTGSIAADLPENLNQ